MTYAKLAEFAKLIRYEDTLPVTLTPLTAPLSMKEIDRCRVRARQLVTLLLADEMHSNEHVDDDSPFARDMNRLHARVSVVTMLLTDVLMRDQQLPEARRVHINDVGVAIDGLIWKSELGARVLVSIHFDDCPAVPLVLPALFIGASESDPTSQVFAYECIDEQLANDMRTLVFRHHRRQIHSQRK